MYILPYLIDLSMFTCTYREEQNVFTIIVLHVMVSGFLITVTMLTEFRMFH
jgi:hypothetical protein